MQIALGPNAMAEKRTEMGLVKDIGGLGNENDWLREM